MEEEAWALTYEEEEFLSEGWISNTMKANDKKY